MKDSMFSLSSSFSSFSSSFSILFVVTTLLNVSIFRVNIQLPAFFHLKVDNMKPKFLYTIQNYLWSKIGFLL